MRRAALLSLPLLASLACGGGDFAFDPTAAPVIDLEARPASALSDYNLLGWDGQSFTWGERVVPYEMNTPLFTDHAQKARALFVPEGEAATYQPDAVFDFPVGSVLIKHFYFPADLREPEVGRRLIETRLLIHYPAGWEAWPYVWEEDGSEAHLAPSGDLQTLSFVDREGASQTIDYLVPQRNQCRQCHELLDEQGAPEIVPIGPKARYLHRDADFGAGLEGQLEHLAEGGLLEGLPEPWTLEAATDFAPIEDQGHANFSAAAVEDAARDYLDINCAHCHNPRHTQGVTSNLWLNHDNRDPFTLGVCKRPGSAGEGTGGLSFDIVPGDPEASILHYRIQTDREGAMMPLLGRTLVHDRGAALIHDWIAGMPADDCGATP